MGLVEVVPGLDTSAQTVAAAKSFVESLGKAAITSGTAPASSSTRC